MGRLGYAERRTWPGYASKTLPPAVLMPRHIAALAERAERVSPFIVMDVMNQAAAIERAGGSVVHMEVGQPSAADAGLASALPPAVRWSMVASDTRRRSVRIR
jgi:hypothetical protein